MLKLYFTELKKIKRQKIVRMIGIVGLIMPIVFLIICLRDDLSYVSLVAQNMTFGNFLIVPCLFSILLLTLFQIEDQNNTLKNILVADVNKYNIFIAKLMVALTAVLIFVTVTWLYSLVVGMFLPKYGNFEKAFIALLVSAMASIAASLPILLIIIIFRKKSLMSMVLINCFVIIDFILVWKLMMMQGRNLILPILIAYRIIIPLQNINDWKNIEPDLPGEIMLYYPPGIGIGLLCLTVAVSLFFSMLIYKKQEV